VSLAGRYLCQRQSGSGVSGWCTNNIGWCTGSGMGRSGFLDRLQSLQADDIWCMDKAFLRCQIGVKATLAGASEHAWGCSRWMRKQHCLAQDNRHGAVSDGCENNIGQCRGMGAGRCGILESLWSWQADISKKVQTRSRFSTSQASGTTHCRTCQCSRWAILQTASYACKMLRKACSICPDCLGPITDHMIGLVWVRVVHVKRPPIC
jgi:hypothetical protein